MKEIQSCFVKVFYIWKICNLLVFVGMNVSFLRDTISIHIEIKIAFVICFEEKLARDTNLINKFLKWIDSKLKPQSEETHK